jgi:hypothetical protein
MSNFDVALKYGFITALSYIMWSVEDNVNVSVKDIIINDKNNKSLYTEFYIYCLNHLSNNTTPFPEAARFYISTLEQNIHYGKNLTKYKVLI